MTNNGRPVWDEHRSMLPTWLTPTQAGIIIGRVARENDEPYTRHGVVKLIQRGDLPAYETPHGRLVHLDDLSFFLQTNYPAQMAALADSEE